MEYFAGKWASAPEWLKDEGYHPTCFPFSFVGLKAALEFLKLTASGELWLAEGVGLSRPRERLNLNELAKGRFV